MKRPTTKRPTTKRPTTKRPTTKRPTSQSAPRIGIVSLGCPKALVDSERILTRLRAEGYEIAATYDGADAVIVNTCGFLDSAKAESLAAIGEALAENGKVIVTGCMGGDPDAIRRAHPSVLAVTGPQSAEAVVNAVHEALPAPHAPFLELVPRQGLRLTPGHYAYLKIAEGCGHACRFCIIPRLRGPLVSRPAGEVLAEAEALAAAGVKELLVIAQDSAAYGADLKHAASDWGGETVKARLPELARALGSLDLWVRLHYVYPYPMADELIPLMAEGLVLPYLDIPFQHASPKILKAMRRPAEDAKTLDRLAAWRRAVPELAVRSSFIVGFPGETEADFQYLLDWLSEAKLDRVGCFQYEPVEGAAANALPDPVPAEVKQERWDRLMAHQQAISEAKQRARIGQIVEVLVDAVDDDEATGRTVAEAPDIDGVVHLADADELEVGDLVTAQVVDADAYDLWVEPPDED